MLTLYLGYTHDDSRHKMEKVYFESTFKKLPPATGLQLFSEDLLLGKQVWLCLKIYLHFSFSATREKIVN